MDDVIYRQDAADFLCDWCGICSKEKRNIMKCDDIAPNFARIPSAQHRTFCYLDSPCPYQNEEIKVTERKGHWRNYEGTLTCSVCETEIDSGIMEYCGDDVPMFCPNCGADMREDGETDG